MRSEELKTFAINTGKFYQQHIDMATEVASLRVWELHFASMSCLSIDERIMSHTMA